MSDSANNDVGQASRPARDVHVPPAAIITTAAILLCIIACTLIFLLPADSLVVDLIYQGF